MKKIFISSLFSVITLITYAQHTLFTVEHFDQKKPGRVEVYSGQKLLGVTDSFGYLSLEDTAWFLNISLHQSGIQLFYEITDTTYSWSLAGGKSYYLRIVPEPMEEAVVKATRGGADSLPNASSLTKADIQIQNTTRDLPLLMQFQPSVITTSDAGNGVGYTGMRIRGSDAARTNITINGVPLNDAESQGTFWVNMPDFASSVQNVQIQRGVGSSTNGAGAFGASVNIQTSNSFKPYGTLQNSAGSFGTIKNSVSAGSGLIQNHWTIDMRLSRIQSNGYIDRAASNLSSWFLSTGFFERKWSVKILAFSGQEKTYQAWYGIPREKINGSDSALRSHYSRNDVRNGGTLYRNAEDSLNLFQSSNRTYNYYTYKNEIDNYRQTHIHAYFNRQINASNSLNVTLYKTLGAGYFEQYRPQDPMSAYGLSPFVVGTDTFRNSDFIRRRWLDNTLTGINANWLHETKKWTLLAGGGYNQYLGNHFGEIIWAQLAPAAESGAHYYDATGDKYDGNIFLKTIFNPVATTRLTADLQLRRVYHQGRGYDNDQRRVRFTGDYLFFNPKMGVQRMLSKGTWLTANVGMGHKEPSRSDFTDQNARIPLPESMIDYELGVSSVQKRYQYYLNLYYMDYTDQLVLTGAVNDVGTPLRTNVAQSYRAGIEGSVNYQVTSKFSINANVAFSSNRIARLVTETTDYADYSVVRDTLQNTPISYSPGTVAALVLVWKPTRSWQLNWNHKYVGKQYLDNTGDADKMLEAYYFSELWVSKTFSLKNAAIECRFQLLNLFNNLYNNNGYSWEYLYGGAGTLTREVFLFPSAPRNYMLAVNLSF